MPTQVKMSVDERRKYLMTVQPRYIASNRKGRTDILTELQQVTRLDRKTLIRLMHSDLKRKRRSKQRVRTYGHEVDDVVRLISRRSPPSHLGEPRLHLR